MACEYQKVAVVARLVEMAEVDVSAVTDDLKNALHIAAIHDSSEIATLLMEKKSSLIVQQDSKVCLFSRCAFQALVPRIMTLSIPNYTHTVWIPHTLLYLAWA